MMMRQRFALARRIVQRSGIAFAMAIALANAAQANVGRPIYSEPGTGIALPPGCTFEPSWRARLANSDLELWAVECTLVPHLWLVRRGVIEYDRDNRARLRFMVLDERILPGETAGETISVQCASRGNAETGVAAIGAKWRSTQGALRLQTAKTAVKVDRRNAKLVDLPVDQIDCTRFLEREETMRRLQESGRSKP